MENKDRPAFPLNSVPKNHPWKGITKYEWFLAHAPETIPEWFRHSMDEFGERPKVRKMAGGADVSEDCEERDKWDWQNKIQRYFQWRQFYALKMCEL